MPSSVIVGSGSSIPPNKVTNDMLARIMDTTDEWIRERTGIEHRYYVSQGTGTSDLALEASRQALEAAGLTPNDIDMIVFATMTPDHYFPGSGGLLQAKLGVEKPIPCFDLRQQCVGFLYGLQLVDAHIRAGMAQNVLLVGAEVHTGFMPFSEDNLQYAMGNTDLPPTEDELAWNTRFRHLAVLFGDAGAAVVVQANESNERGIVDHLLHTNGADYDKLYVPGAGFKQRPYIDAEQLERGDHIPVMDGRYVFRSATQQMANVARRILERNGLAVDDLALCLMHQANRRINEFVQRSLGLPDERVLHNIQRYGNTTAATVPLLWDESVRSGRLAPGDLVLLVAFGAGMNWGATLVRA